MGIYHNAGYWNTLARDITSSAQRYSEILFLANLVLQDPASWWTKRALRKTVCLLIARNAQLCINQILVAGHDTAQDLAWRGLVCDNQIMHSLRSHATDLQRLKLQVLATAALQSKTRRGSSVLINSNQV